MKNQLNYLPFLIPLLLGMTMIDPTRPPDVTLKPHTLINVKTLKVSAIFIYPHDRVAIINDQTAKIGDKIGEFSITNITPYTVELMGPENNKEVLSLIVPIKKRSE